MEKGRSLPTPGVSLGPRSQLHLAEEADLVQPPQHRGGDPHTHIPTRGLGEFWGDPGPFLAAVTVPRPLHSWREQGETHFPRDSGAGGEDKAPVGPLVFGVGRGEHPGGVWGEHDIQPYPQAAASPCQHHGERSGVFSSDTCIPAMLLRERHRLRHRSIPSARKCQEVGEPTHPTQRGRGPPPTDTGGPTVLLHGSAALRTGVTPKHPKSHLVGQHPKPSTRSPGWTPS